MNFRRDDDDEEDAVGFVIEDDDDAEEEDNSEEEDDSEDPADESGGVQSDEDGQEDDGEEEVLEEPKSRPDKRIQKLANARKEEAARRLQLEQQNAALQSQLQQITQQSRSNTAAEREVYLASLSPEERRQAMLEDSLVAQQHNMRMLEFNIQDSADRSSYEAHASVNPVYKKLQGRVEAKLTELRSKQGIWAPRIEILKNVIGELVLANKLKPVNKAQAKKNVIKQKTKPASGGRSDAVVSGNRSGGSKEVQARQKRLDSYKF
jgi:hypothetical protein